MAYQKKRLMYWSTCLSPVSFFFCDPASVPRGLFSFRKCVNAAVRYPLGRKSTERHWNHRTRGLPTNFVFSPAIDRFHRPHSRDRSPVKRATKRIACLWNAPFTLFFLCSSPPQKKTFFFRTIFRWHEFWGKRFVEILLTDTRLAADWNVLRYYCLLC